MGAVTFLNSGESEDVKLAYHATLGALAVGALVYNAAAFTQRKQPHLAMNVLLYGTLAVLEARKVRHHWEAL